MANGTQIKQTKHQIIKNTMYHSTGQYTGQSLGKRKTKTANQHHRSHHSNSMHCICTTKENGNSTSANDKYIGTKAVADNNQPINKISYRQQISTLQNESLQKTKQRKNETKP